ncbi:hypothetical protein DYBT9623_00607 [Dyadobacter sp. CECT 9623]|uniref:Uncharacterized protein n=1 Tax=Dyadobacter linearis TaxID=2823330 RepID=A0ABM8UK84_9BACT|nr:hypothetical protein [Dyadobacter sp. CECT 9623]CAG5067880.1 hypothetical protein DYBT9623_00607 [Dyadobacter sp. CECT 9623]
MNVAKAGTAKSKISAGVQVEQPVKKMSLVDEKMEQMRTTLEQHPIPEHLLSRNKKPRNP